MLPKTKFEPNSIRQRRLSKLDKNHPEAVIMRKYRGFELIRTMCAGEGFGEIALRHNSTRTATVVCSQDSHFLTLDRDSYDQLLRKPKFNKISM